MKRPALVTILLLSSTLAGPALAEDRPTVETKDYVDRTAGGDRVVVFSTDGLEGDTRSIFGFGLRRPPGVVRVGLIRPRVSFVAELLKSVENL